MREQPMPGALYHLPHSRNRHFDAKRPRRGRHIVPASVEEHVKQPRGQVSSTANASQAVKWG
jgi:hypothetical protein